eukprot:TRINITY_DN3334_c0_g1_i1.p2 TRINITY_DN3334_c0_g1~~TRINITY_DN3334_c0_g1_i1.p2  ORF type:complete len:148 (-),score=18.31 TRINITY_DN3334_c0_g1_i1:729-1172(-)
MTHAIRLVQNVRHTTHDTSSTFAGLTARARLATSTDSDIQLLLSRVTDNLPTDCICTLPTNDLVNKHNDAVFQVATEKIRLWAMHFRNTAHHLDATTQQRATEDDIAERRALFALPLPKIAETELKQSLWEKTLPVSVDIAVACRFS